MKLTRNSNREPEASKQKVGVHISLDFRVPKHRHGFGSRVEENDEQCREENLERCQGDEVPLQPEHRLEDAHKKDGG